MSLKKLKDSSDSKPKDQQYKVNPSALQLSIISEDDEKSVDQSEPDVKSMTEVKVKKLMKIKELKSLDRDVNPKLENELTSELANMYLKNNQSKDEESVMDMVKRIEADFFGNIDNSQTSTFRMTQNKTMNAG